MLNLLWLVLVSAFANLKSGRGLILEPSRCDNKASREEAARYAGAIRTLREERGLTQADIAGLTERQVRRVEQGESTPRTQTLRKLAAAHGLSLDGYLKELAKRSKARRY